MCSEANYLVYISFYFHKKSAKIIHIIGKLQHKIGTYNIT